MQEDYIIRDADQLNETTVSPTTSLLSNDTAINCGTVGPRSNWFNDNSQDEDIYYRSVIKDAGKKVKMDNRFNGYSLSGLAVPVLMEFCFRADNPEKKTSYLPAFITCAHCAEKNKEYRRKIKLVSPSFDADKSFEFDVNPLDFNVGVFGCDAQDSKKIASLDILILFLKYKNNLGKEKHEKFWMTEEKFEKKDYILMNFAYQKINDEVTTFENSPKILEGFIKDHRVRYDGEQTQLASHNLPGLHGMSGGCMYFDCRSGSKAGVFERLLLVQV